MIIGLGYKAKSGKDTLADILVSHHGFTKLSFAAPLKQAVRVIFGFSTEQIDGDQKETLDPFWNLTPRKVMQLFGNEAMKPVYGVDLWVRTLARQLNILDKRHVVITDVRFLVEAAAVHQWGGILVRVDRDGSGASHGVNKHPSEIELDSYGRWDRVIDNNGSLEDLRLKAQELVK